jgi:hypothetical protein
MFVTQPISELGLVGYTLLGLYCDEAEPTTQQGMGAGWTKGHEELLTVLHNKHGRDAIVVNTKVITAPGRGHPSYAAVRYMVIGDLYVKSAALPEAPKLPVVPYERAGEFALLLLPYTALLHLSSSQLAKIMLYTALSARVFADGTHHVVQDRLDASGPASTDALLERVRKHILAVGQEPKPPIPEAW